MKLTIFQSFPEAEVSNSSSLSYAWLQDASNQGYHMHPALTDAVTHLGAFKDTDRSPDGTAASARVPVALSLYKATMLKKHVGKSDPIADFIQIVCV